MILELYEFYNSVCKATREIKKLLDTVDQCPLDECRYSAPLIKTSLNQVQGTWYSLLNKNYPEDSPIMSLLSEQLEILQKIHDRMNERIILGQ